MKQALLRNSVESNPDRRSRTKAHEGASEPAVETCLCANGCCRLCMVKIHASRNASKAMAQTSAAG